jgi:hypothetical protein
MYIYENVSLDFFQWVMLELKFVEEIKTHILCSINFFYPKIVPYMQKCGKI